MKVRWIKALALGVICAGAATSLASCSSWDAAHNHNAPTPVRQWEPANGWERIMTPGSFPSMVFACHGKDGIYDNQDSSSSPFVVPNDPECS